MGTNAPDESSSEATDIEEDSGSTLGLLPILLEMMTKIKQEEEPAALQEQISTSGSKHISLKELKKDNKKVAQKIIDNYQKTGEQIDSTIQRMNELKDNFRDEEIQLMQNDIIKMLKEIRTKTIQKEKYIEERIKRLEHQKREIKEKQSRMEEALQNLDEKTSYAEAAPLLDEVEDFNTKAKANLQSFTQIISRDEEALNTLQKDAKDTKEKMSVIRKVLNSPVEGEDIQFLSAAQQSSTHNTVPAQKPTGSCRKILVPARSLPEQGKSNPMEPSPTPDGAHKHISMDDFLERNEDVLRLIRQGKVYAEQEEGGRRRHARMTLDEENRICVHHLSNVRLHPLPQGAHLLQHNDVMSVVNPSSTRRSFLELETDEESFGRIVINLKQTSKRAENFFALCSGHFGPSYVKTKLFEVICKDEDAETVEFGDYEFNDGEGGNEVIPGAAEEWGGEWEGPWVVGSVVGCRGGRAKASQFGIVTKDDPNDKLDAVFGTVDAGLNVIQDLVSRFSDIKKVNIADCGIILPV